MRALRQNASTTNMYACMLKLWKKPIRLFGFFSSIPRYTNKQTNFSHTHTHIYNITLNSFSIALCIGTHIGFSDDIFSLSLFFWLKRLGAYLSFSQCDGRNCVHFVSFHSLGLWHRLNVLVCDWFFFFACFLARNFCSLFGFSLVLDRFLKYLFDDIHPPMTFNYWQLKKIKKSNK